MPVLVFRFGALVFAASRELGTLAGLLLSADGRRWEGLVLQRGLVRKQCTALRHPSVVQATESRLLLAAPAVEETTIPAEHVLKQGMLVRTQDGTPCGRVERAIGTADGQLLQLVLHRDRHPTRVVLPAGAIGTIGPEGLVCSLAPDAAAQLAPYRPDPELVAAVHEALDEVDGVPQLERGQFRVFAEAGVVTLSGHVSTRLRAEAMAAAAAAVPGVLRVESRLVDDVSLQCAAAAALARDPRTRGCACFVGVQHGCVTLGGTAPDAASAAAAGEVVGQLNGVRAVVNRISAPGFTPDVGPVWHPAIGATVVSADHQDAGRVERLVLHPSTRRLAGLVITMRCGGAGNGATRSRQAFVSAADIVDVTPVTVRLRLSAAELGAAPPAELYTRRPAATWQPPYPYSVDECLWPAEGVATGRGAPAAAS